MRTTILGRTGLKVSVMGLGCGGPSRIGQSTGTSNEDSIAIVKQALGSGINFIDTAESYQTEKIVGRAIKGVNRGSIVISSKKSTPPNLTHEEVKKSFEASLKNLSTDYIDIYHLHALLLKDYDYYVSEILPILLEMKDQGRIRFIGITEMWNKDTGHLMLQRALEDDYWDVMMVGFNILNQTARDRVLLPAMEKNIGILNMFAVRLALSNRPKRLKRVIKTLLKNNQINPSDINVDDALGFLTEENQATDIVDAAYRFCLHEPGMHVILSGTGNSDHLAANIESFSRPPLPQDITNRLKKIFQNVDSVTGQ
jgi:aryl-alcohol dehydrogenase-like predicted oxidoreductase